jgi:hypothetical protein
VLTAVSEISNELNVEIMQELADIVDKKSL